MATTTDAILRAIEKQSLSFSDAIREQAAETRSMAGALTSLVTELKTEREVGKSATGRTNNWELIAALAGILFGLMTPLYFLASAQNTEIREHTRDNHPDVVVGQIKELRADYMAFKAAAGKHTEACAQHTYDQQRDAVARASQIGRIDATQQLLLQSVIETMKLNGMIGRSSAEDRGRSDEAIKHLEQQVNAIQAEQVKRAERVYKDPQ